MKTTSLYCASIVAGLGIFLAASECAHGTISVDAETSFEDVTIDSTSGTIEFTTALQTSAFAQAGANSQYSAATPSGATATDVPVTGGLTTGGGTSSLPMTGASGATGFIPGMTDGFDTSTGRASANGVFEITGVTGPVTVTFSATISAALNLSSDAYGVAGQGESVFSLSVDGTPTLFNDNLLSIGPNQIQSDTFSGTLTDTMTLMGDTPYWLWVEADSEAMVVNSSNVPDSLAGGGMAACLAASVLLLILMRRRQEAKEGKRLALALAGMAVAGMAMPARALYIGSDAPDICLTCGAQPTRQLGGMTSTSLTEGNIREDYPVVTVKSAYGPTLPFVLTYNSYDADGSRAQLDTGMGFGWTHAYNGLLFQQRGEMFRLGPDGRVTQYDMNFSGAGGAYNSDSGYFETLTTQSDGTLFVTNKNESWWHYGSVPNTPFLVAGPVFRLLQMGDRNQNTTTMSYDAGGHLTTVTDPFGRALHFTYDAHNHLSTITDPLGRTTQLQYDPLSRVPTQITDPLGNTVHYTYNSQYQITRKLDRDGRMYFYMYKGLRPFSVTDGNGQPWFSMSNPTDWAVNSTNLAFTMRRQYNPSTTSSTDGNGHVWQYAYDTNGYVTERIAPDGSVTKYTYDPTSKMLSTVTDANSHTTHYEYDTEGNRIKTTDALGNITTYTYEPVFNMMTSMTDPNGRTTSYNYDTHGNRIKETDALSQTQSWTYDTHGNVTSWTDKRGFTTQFHYDSSGDLIETIDPLSETTTDTYDAVGNRISMTDGNGHTTIYTYDLDDRQIETTDPLSHTSITAYDEVGNVISTTDANGHTTRFTYDERDRRVEKTNALGGISQTTYDENNNVVSRIDENGHTTSYGYDTLNRQTSSTDPLGEISTTTYDAVGNVTSTTDANGHTTDNTYDALNRRVETTDPTGNVTSYQYANTAGPPCCGATAGSALVTGMVDADSKYTYYHYDELNRRYQVVKKSGSTNDAITPSDAVTTTTYDADNNRIAVTDPNNNTITTTYDGLNRMTKEIDAAGDVSTTAYDAVGNVIETVDPRGNVTTSVYDDDNRQISQTDSIGPMRSESYDAVGNVISTTDGNGNVTSTTYDALDRQIQVIDPLGFSITTAYDAVGNVISTTDRNGNSTDYAYDADNRQTSLTDPLSETTARGYDPVGNLISVTDQLGHATDYTYDDDNRRIQETYPDTPSDTRSWTYDGTAHVISRLDQNGQTTTYDYNDFYYLTNREYTTGPADLRGYDLGGRVISAERNGWTNKFTYDGADRLLTTTQNGQPVTYTYDVPGGMRTIDYPGGATVTEMYDSRSRLVSVDDGGPILLTQYTYDLDNNMLTRSNRNGTASTNIYDADNRITETTHNHGVTLLAGYAYTYDHEGNKLSQRNETAATDSESYAYDALDRLTAYSVGTLSGGVIPAPSVAESYNLDAVGNWTTFVSNAVTETRTHNAINELLTVDAQSVTYDGNGNLLNDGRNTYAYDAENRITAVTRDSDSALVGQYAYDALGRRVESVENPSGTPETNIMFYDGRRIIEEQNAGMVTQTTYTYAMYVDDIQTMSRAGQTYYYHPNALHSVEAVTDSTGTPVERYTYDAYGEPTVQDGDYNPMPLNSWGTPHSAITNEFLFTGRQFDEESGLYCYRARYYDSFKGRFLSRDPIERRRRNLNLYEYVESKPTKYMDPLGLFLWPWEDCCEGVVYNKIGSCCCEGKVTGKGGVDVGVKRCHTELGLGIPFHQWLEIGNWSAGFYPVGDGVGEVLYGPGNVESPDTASFDPEKVCEDHGGSRCFLQFDKFRKCIKDEAAKAKASPPKYCLFGHNCGDWAANLTSKCFGQSRGCTPPDKN